jgi:hypothetical protein
MKLSEVVASYVAHKQSMGMRFRTEARTLKSFCRAMGEVNIQQVKPDRVKTCLAGTGPVTRFWQLKHNILDAFYRFAIARGYVGSTPLPRTFPKHCSPSFLTFTLTKSLNACSVPSLPMIIRAARSIRPHSVCFC